MTRLRQELEPLRRGKLINLYVSEQQYAYARKSARGVVLIALNNDKSAARFEFEVRPTGLTDSQILSDSLGSHAEVKVTGGKVTVNLPTRSAVVLAPR